MVFKNTAAYSLAFFSKRFPELESICGSLVTIGCSRCCMASNVRLGEVEQCPAGSQGHSLLEVQLS